MASPSRRAVLAGIAAGATGLGGCLGLGSTAEDPFETYGPVAAAVSEVGVGWADLGELEGELEIYSGRDRTQIQPLFDDLEAAYPDLDLRVRYGTSSGLVGQIDAEGANTNADVFYTQDAATLGALKARGRTAALPEDVLSVVTPSWRDPDGEWTGVSGRVRSIVHNTDVWSAAELPDDIFAYAEDDRFTGEIGIRPTSGSFQAFAAAMRVAHGDAVARAFFERLVDERDARTFEGGSQIIDAIAREQVSLALENQYYVVRYLADTPGAPVGVHYTAGDVGALFNVSGCAIIDATAVPNLAAEVLRHVLAVEGQRFFVEVTGEYPVREDVDYAAALPPLAALDPPAFDLNDLADLQGTVDLLREAGVTM